MPRSAVRTLTRFAATATVLVLPWLFSSSLHALIIWAMATSFSPLAAPRGPITAATARGRAAAVAGSSG